MIHEQMTSSAATADPNDEQLDDEFFSENDADEGMDEIDSFVLDEDDSDVFAESEAVFS